MIRYYQENLYNYIYTLMALIYLFIYIYLLIYGDFLVI